MHISPQIWALKAPDAVANLIFHTQTTQLPANIFCSWLFICVFFIMQMCMVDFCNVDEFSPFPCYMKW